MKEILNTDPDHEIVTIRDLNYPKHLVYQAWTDPFYLRQWWGPKGFTNTFHKHELRPGGEWIFTMHGPDKGHYENACTFLLVDAPHRLAWDRISQPHFQVDVSFEAIGKENTRVTFRMKFYSEDVRKKLINFVPEKNEENFDRLEDVLKKMTDE